MKPPKPTRADKHHYEELVETINEAYVDGKPMSRVLELITLRRWQVQEAYEGRMFKAKRRAKIAEARAEELESGVTRYLDRA